MLPDRLQIFQGVRLGCDVLPCISVRLNANANSPPHTQNDDRTPARIASRNLFDLAVVEDNLFNGDRYRWNPQFTIVNKTSDYALYNFLSTFNGTHYESPRAITAQIGFHF